MSRTAVRNGKPARRTRAQQFDALRNRLYSALEADLEEVRGTPFFELGITWARFNDSEVEAENLIDDQWALGLSHPVSAATLRRLQALVERAEWAATEFRKQLTEPLDPEESVLRDLFRALRQRSPKFRRDLLDEVRRINAEQQSLRLHPGGKAS